jgi:hypothetical protein
LSLELKAAGLSLSLDMSPLEILRDPGGSQDGIRKVGECRVNSYQKSLLVKPGCLQPEPLHEFCQGL